MPSSARSAHDVEDVADQLRVERRGRLVEEHQLRLHRQRAGDGHALLLAAGELRGVVAGLVGRGRRGPAAALARSRASALVSPLTWTGASMTFSSAVMCGKRLKRWKTMPMSRRWAATSLSLQLVELVALLPVADQLAVDVQPPGVDLLQVVDAPQEGRLAGAGGADEAEHLRGATSRSMPLRTSTGPKDLWTPSAFTMARRSCRRASPADPIGSRPVAAEGDRVRLDLLQRRRAAADAASRGRSAARGSTGRR